MSDGSFCFQISGSGSTADFFSKSASPLAASGGRSQEYDSGKDMSLPPSTQTSWARSWGQEKGSPGGDLSKSRDLNSGNTSYSGNSFTTSSPQNKEALLPAGAVSQGQCIWGGRVLAATFRCLSMVPFSFLYLQETGHSIHVCDMYIAQTCTCIHTHTHTHTHTHSHRRATPVM